VILDPEADPCGLCGNAHRSHGYGLPWRHNLEAYLHAALPSHGRKPSRWKACGLGQGVTCAPTPTVRTWEARQQMLVSVSMAPWHSSVAWVAIHAVFAYPGALYDSHHGLLKRGS